MTSIKPELAASYAVGEQHALPAEADQKRELWRFWFLIFVFATLITFVVLALFTHQALQLGGTRPVGLPHQGESPRGSIVDRNGALLAADRYFYEISVNPTHLKTDAERRVLADELERLAGIPAVQTLEWLQQYTDRYFLRLAPAVELEVGHRILAEQQKLAQERRAHPLLYLNLTPAPQRYYPEGPLAAHVVGFTAMVGNAIWRRGVAGVEGYYESFLRQRDGVGLTGNATASWESLPEQVRRYLPSVTGRDLVLTIDRGVQWIAEEELRRALELYQAKAGTILVMDPSTGEVLAMANAPAFDPNRIAEADPAALLNPAVSTQYEPGSVFKIITAAAALDTGVVTPTQKLTDTGAIAVGQRLILNSDRAGYGPVDMSEALARSLNVISAQWALLLGERRFYQYVDRFGFGRVTEIDLAGEIYGAVRKPGHEKWSLSDLGTNSFGQGLAVTPIQMANATAAIANGGKLMRPYVVKARILDGQVQYTEPTVLGVAIQPETAKTLTDILVSVVERGNQAAGVAGYRIAGKSGTAQIPGEQGYEEDDTIVTFVGFAPADDPRFVILVKLERPDPSISRWAGYTAAPTFAQVARRLFQYYNIPPDEIRLGANQSVEQSGI
jgi:cell division protein FtsI/penicillin-binding protein 2